MKEKVLEVYKSFFDNLGIDYDSLDIKEKEENIFLVKIKTTESGILIGQNGKSLEAINNILRIIVKQNIKEKVRVYLEINDYLANKDENLKRFIFSKVEIVEKTGRDIKLPFYNAYDRKKIHSFVSEYGNDKVFTKSIGEARDRRLYICKKEEGLSIDLDSIDI